MAVEVRSLDSTTNMLQSDDYSIRFNNKSFYLIFMNFVKIETMFDSFI